MLLRTPKGLLSTYRGNSARGRDCAHRPGRLSESVSEHGDRGLCIKEKIRIQLQEAIDGGEIGDGLWWFKTFALFRWEMEIQRAKWGASKLR